MSTSGYPSRTRGGAVGRGLLRAAFFLAVVSVAVWWSVDEPSTGHKAFLLSVAGLMALVVLWGLVETRRELRMIRGRSTS